MVVDGAVPDAAAAQVGDEGLPQPVQERTAEQDGDARGTGVRVDVGHMGGLDPGGVEAEHALGLVVVDGDPVQGQQPGDDVDVTYERDVAQHRRRGAQQRRHHGLGDEVLGAAHGDLAGERAPALDLEQSVDH